MPKPASVNQPEPFSPETSGPGPLSPGPLSPGPLSPGPLSPGPLSPEPEDRLDDTVRETLLAILIAFVLAFVFRAYLVEPFVIPTGSMNPTLKGLHAQIRCSDCGYRFHLDILPEQTIDTVQDAGGSPLRVYSDRITDPRLVATCSMCGHAQPLPGRLKAPGDRILVDKFEYAWSKPSRWDVVVFKNPQASNDDGSPGPATNYVKRLIGLPGETIFLIDGDVYTSRDGGENFQIARKTDAGTNLRWRKIQEATWQPVYHSRYYPRFQDGRLWQDPWRFQNAGWTRTRTGYHYETPAGADPSGALLFDFGDRPQQALRTYGYNQATGEARHVTPIEDVRIAATLIPKDQTPKDQSACTLTLSTTARLNHPDGDIYTIDLIVEPDGRMRLIRWVDPTRQVTLSSAAAIGPVAEAAVTDAPETAAAETAATETAATKTAATKTATPETTALRTTPPRTTPPRVTRVESLIDAQTAALKPGVPIRVELWVVDQTLLIWRDDKLIGRHDLPTRPVRQLAQRKRADRAPRVQIAVAGGDATLTDIALDRDVYYESGRTDGGRIGLGGLVIDDDKWSPARSKPIDLGPGHYFCVGDNPPRSSDGRFWLSVEPFVRQRFLGDARNPAGIIPAELLIGRAFFVYLPAPFPIAERSSTARAIPNLADIRFVH